jgi:hypothetical protein
MKMKFRGLKADEIEIRIDRITEKGAWLLLFKNARVDMALLDEVVGEEYWQRDHKELKGNMYSGVGIFSDKLGTWVWKWDCGTESYTEKEKGEASDSFKRACSCWGIGRELYTAPDIFVACPTEKNDKGKTELKDKWLFNDAYVNHITYREEGNMRFIDTLAVADKKGNIIWSNVGKSSEPIDPTEPKEEAPDLNARISMADKKALEGRLERMNYPVLKICTNYKIKSLSEMTVAQFVDCARQLTNIEEKRKKQAKEGEI